jgi:predicted N-acetyltransferase YhbS
MLVLIAAGLVFVAEDEQGVPRGYVALRPTGMGGLILLEGIFVDPACSRSGVGTRLFATAGQGYSCAHAPDSHARSPEGIPYRTLMSGGNH